MQADYSVELGADDPILSVPWASSQGAERYFDLRSQPDLLLYVEEGIHYPELGEFLAHVNSGRSCLQSSKCDAWFTTELNEEEQIYGAGAKFGSYIDLFFTVPEERADFAAHELLAKQLTVLLQRAPELPSALEVLIRRAYFEEPPGPAKGCYFTLYVFGYGDEEEEARSRWAVSLKLVENALFQLSAQRAHQG